MSIPTVYIQGTKKEANEKLTAGHNLPCQQFDMRGSLLKQITDMPDGTVIKFWVKRDHVGTPIAKSYGNWKPSKNKIV